MAGLFRTSSTRKSRERSLPNSKKNRQNKGSAAAHYFETSRSIETALFLVFFVLVTLICFAGQEPKGPQFILGVPAPARIVADFSFDYTSEIAAEERRRAARAQVPPVFRRSFEPYKSFERNLREINSAIARAQIEHETEETDTLRRELKDTIRSALEDADLRIDPDTVISLTRDTAPNERSNLFDDALEILRDLYEKGIYSPKSATPGDPSERTVIQLLREDGREDLPNAQSLEKALVELRRRIDTISPDAETAGLIFKIFREGLRPNLLYSPEATNRAIERAVSKVDPPVFEIEKGQTLIEPGSEVTRRDLERINAYRAKEEQLGSDTLILNRLFIERFVLTGFFLSAVFIYVKQGMRDYPDRNRAIGLTAVSLLLNLLIIRLILEFGETALRNEGPSLSILPFTTPFALAPILVTVLIGTAPAVIAALVVAVLFGIMQDNSIEFLLIVFLTGIVGTFASINVRTRSRLARSGLLAGTTAALTAALIGIFNNPSPVLIGQQSLTALIVGLLTGVLVIGLLPFFEQSFKITTDITLLELTDFNHPLLRRMQVEAPGSYHHSLMVANLSENAASKIGASPLLCRVCCFFHDIGKLVKPEYFVENQLGGPNPHQAKNPSMSALVIKAHVKEGVELARKHKLPKVIIDVIRQHHGTTLIQFFYRQARDQQKTETTAGAAQSGSRNEAPAKKIDESTYRYDGPKPAFKESAIIFFADGVEAASRSLKKVTQPAVEELIEDLFRERIEDGQLDECPLTFKELEQIRGSFVFTVLNMLHARVEYPKEKTDTESNKQEKGKKETATSEKPTDHDEPSSGSQQPI